MYRLCSRLSFLHCELARRDSPLVHDVLIIVCMAPGPFKHKKTTLQLFVDLGLKRRSPQNKRLRTSFTKHRFRERLHTSHLLRPICTPLCQAVGSVTLPAPWGCRLLLSSMKNEYRSQKLTRRRLAPHNVRFRGWEHAASGGSDGLYPIQWSTTCAEGTQGLLPPPVLVGPSLLHNQQLDTSRLINFCFDYVLLYTTAWLCDDLTHILFDASLPPLCRERPLKAKET